MKLNCQHVSASEAGHEIFQVLFAAQPEQEDGPYVLISHAFLEEDEGESSSIYVETHDEGLIGHYPQIDAQLTRSRLTIRLPSPGVIPVPTSPLNVDAGTVKVAPPS